MAQHISRKELKTDHIREGFVHGAEAVASHQNQAWAYGGMALIVDPCGAGLAVLYAEADRQGVQRTQRRHENISGSHHHARRTTAPDELTYVDEKNRDGDAVKEI